MDKKDEKAEEKTEEKTEEIPKEFNKVIKDLFTDLLTVFPEYREIEVHKGLKDIGLGNEDTEEAKEIFEFCKEKYPERFFDILYQNEKLFIENDNLELLPGFDFCKIWKDVNLTENSRNTIWQYLKLILFSVVGNLSDGNSFGDTTKLFEAINEDEFKSKLEESVKEMQGMFDTSGNLDSDDMPNPEELHDHITGMLDGQIGKLAKELAQETAEELDIDLENEADAGNIFQKMFKNPGKLMGLVKKIGSKLDSKLKSGDLNEKELMKEATDLMGKMNSMPGMGNIQQMMNKMNGAGGMKGMQSQMSQMMAQNERKERMLKKLEKKKQEKGEENMKKEMMAQQTSSVQSQIKKKKKKKNKGKEKN
jgi:hypothetical protein